MSPGRMLCTIGYLAIAALVFEFLVRGQSPLQRSALRLMAVAWPLTLGGYLLYQLGVGLYKAALRLYVKCVHFASPAVDTRPALSPRAENTPTARYTVPPCPICGATIGPCDAGLHS